MKTNKTKKNTDVPVETETSQDEINKKAVIPHSDNIEGINRITLEFNKKGIKKTTGYIIGIAFVILSIAWILNNDDKFSNIVDGVYKVLSPFVVGFAIAFVLNVLMRPLESLWSIIFKKNGKISSKLKRAVCLLLSVIIMFGFIVALLFMIIPEFVKTFNNIVEIIPEYATRAIGWFNNLRAFALRYNVKIPEFNFNPDYIINFLKNNLANSSTLNKTLDFTSSLLTGIVNLIVSLAFSVYLLAQKEKLINNLKKTLYAFFPEKKIDRLVDIAGMTDQTFTRFISGQLLEAIIIGVLCFIGMLIFNMPYAPVISVLVGFTALIPVFGAFIGTAIGAFLILFDSPAKAFWFIVFIVVLQQLEGNLIYPKVVGKSVGLPGIWVLAAVTIGGNTMGVTGIILAVPACAVLYSLLRKAVYGKLNKKNAQKSQTEDKSELKQTE